MWLDRLNMMKKESKKTLEDIALISGVPKGTLNKLFSGQTKDPQLTTIKAVVHCLGYTLDDLDDESSNNGNITSIEQAHLNKYRATDEYGKQTVDIVLDREYKRTIEQQSQKAEKPEVTSLPQKEKHYIGNPNDTRTYAVARGKSAKFIQGLVNEEDVDKAIEKYKSGELKSNPPKKKPKKNYYYNEDYDDHDPEY